MKISRWILLFTVCMGMTFVAQSAHAKRPEKVFGGQIITSAKRFPTKAKSVGEYIKKIRKAKSTRFQEDTEKKRWKVYIVGFFKKPLNDVEVTVRLYDVSSGSKQMLKSFEMYTDGPGNTSMTGKVEMDRASFGVNKKILITMESRKKVLAQGTFHILGKAETFSGKVDFSE